MVPILSQMNPVHTLPSCILKAHPFSFVPVEKVHQSPSSCIEIYKTGFLGWGFVSSFPIPKLKDDILSAISCS